MQQHAMQRQALIQRIEADERAMTPGVLQTSVMADSHQAPYASDPNSINVGNLPQTYQPTIRESELTSRILDLMTSEDGSLRFQRSLLGQGFVYPLDLVQYIMQHGYILIIAAKDDYGIESVKVFIDFVKQYPHMFNWVTSALEENVVELMMHPTASKLILYCLRTLSYRQKLFLFQAATRNCKKLGKNAIGKVILEECIKFSQDSQRRNILNRLLYHALTLSKTSKGNLVLQFALKIGDQEFDRDICRVLKNHLEDLSTDENGSYVIEACLKSSGGEELVRKLAGLEKNELERLVTDRYANYIIQTALKISKGTSLYDELVHAIRGLSEELREENFYATKVFRCIGSLEREIKSNH